MNQSTYYSKIDLNNLEIIPEDNISTFGAIAGLNDKYITTDKRFIIKQYPAQDDAINEHICYLLAKSVGIKTVESTIVNLKKKISIKMNNFMYGIQGSESSMYNSMEDGALWTVENAVKTVRSRSINPHQDFLRLIQILTFDLVVGNTDRHQGNLSLIEVEGGAMLSPMYDTLRTYSDSDQLFAIGTSTIARPTFKEMISELRRLEFQDIVLDICAQTKSKLDCIRWVHPIGDSYADLFFDSIQEIQRCIA